MPGGGDSDSLTSCFFISARKKLWSAHNCRSEFEWTEHTAFARRSGLTDDEIDAIASGADPGWSDRERLLLVAADELHAETAISRATWTALAPLCTTAELVEAIYVVGQYTMLSMVANGLGTVTPST